MSFIFFMYFTLPLVVIPHRNGVIRSFCGFTVTRYYIKIPIGINVHWNFYNDDRIWHSGTLPAKLKMAGIGQHFKMII